MIRELNQTDIDQLLSQTMFKLIRPSDRARLITHIQITELEEAQVLFDESSAMEQVFLIQRGEFAVSRCNSHMGRIDGFLGEELALGSASYCSKATALNPASVYVIPARYLITLVGEYPALKTLLFNSYSNAPDAGTLRMPPSSVGEEKTSDASREPVVGEQAGKKGRTELLGWILAILMPILVWNICINRGLPADTAHFLGIVICAVLMWIFNLTPAFVPPLFSLLAVILFDVASPGVATAGFSSSGFFMLLSVFSIGALMIMSGLTYRISLQILRRVPSSPFWYNVSLFLYGLILTPVMPSQAARTVIVAPFLSTLMESCGGKKKDPAATNLFVSAIAGVSLMASIFLTGKPANLIVFGLFDQQTQFSFEWLSWLYAASFAGICLLSMHLIVSRLVFKKSRQVGIPEQVIASQIKTLGSMSRMEWAAVFSIGLIILGILSAPYHKVEIPWLSLSILVAMLLFGVIKNDDMSKRIDWSVLIFIGSIVTWVPIMKLTGIDAQIAGSFGGLGSFMKSNLTAFIGMLCIAIILIRLALPELVTEILLVTLLLPLSGAAGISPWLIGFVILTMSEAYIFPYQAPYHVLLQNQLRAQKLDELCDERKIVMFNITMTVARIAVIFASFPFWSLLDII